MTDSPTCVNGEDDCTLRLHISGIVHGLCDPFVARGDHRQESGLCNIDWTNALSPVDESSNYENKIKKLASGLKDQARSVGLMITDDGQRVCTGTMLNNGAQDGRQLFLTASHCIPRKSTSNFLLAFGFERSSDKASFATGETGQGSGFQALQVVHGLRLLSRWEKSDFALMEVIETIPDSWGVFYAGWSRAAKPPSNVICIHQPSGDFKKLSYYEGETKLSFWREIPAMYHWGVPSWSCGVTEPGSSGSAIFTEEDGLVVGHLHGGIASCIFDDGYDIFGALAFDWEEAPSIENQLKHYLDPLDLNILSMTGSYYHLSSKNRKTEIINTSGHSDMLIPAGKIATNPARFTYNDEQNLNEMKNLRKMASRVGLKIIERQNQTGMIPDPKTCNFD